MNLNRVRCASGAAKRSNRVAAAELPVTEEDLRQTIYMGKLEITRSKGFADALRAYQIALDGQIIGEIKKGATETFDIAPGAHTIALKIDWASSETVSFAVQHEEIVRFECGNNTTFLTVLFRTFLKPETYLWVKRTD